MPYEIVKRGSKFCVVKKENPSGETFGCHPSKEAAQKQIVAILINEKKK